MINVDVDVDADVDVGVDAACACGCNIAGKTTGGSPEDVVGVSRQWSIVGTGNSKIIIVY